MKKFNIITIFPHIFSAQGSPRCSSGEAGGPASGGDFCGYFGESIIKRAREKKLVDINIVNLRDFTKDKHKTVDDSPFGGGAGMILKVEPIYRAVQNVLNVESAGNDKLNKRSDSTSKTIATSRTILFSAKGKKYTQKDAVRLSKYDNLVLICGRYEGVDERVAKYIADEEISIGDYVLSGGEIPAMILVDSISRLMPGVLGNPKSLEEESHNPIQDTKYKIQNTNLEYPQYTRPEAFNKWKVPKVLLSGNHKEIKKWRVKSSKLKSQN